MSISDGAASKAAGFHHWKQKNRMVAHRHRDATVPKAQHGMPTVFHKKLFRQRVTQRLRKLLRKRAELIQKSAVFVFYHRVDDSKLAERREMWSRSAKIGSMDLRVAANPMGSHGRLTAFNVFSVMSSKEFWFQPGRN